MREHPRDSSAPALSDGATLRAHDAQEPGSNRPPAADGASSAGFEILNATFDNLRQGFLVLDDQWRVKNFNVRLCELFGCTPDALQLGSSVYDLLCLMKAAGLYPGRTARDAWEAWRRRLESRKPGERLARLPDGRTLEIHYAPLGKRGWVVTYEDVSARVNAEKALADQNERLDLALTNIPQAIAMFDADKNLILCNARYMELLSIPRELTSAGTPLQCILDHIEAVGVAPIRMADYFEFASQARAAGTTKSARIELRDGRFVQITHSPLSGGGFLGTLEDVTQAVRAEEQIRYLGSHDGLTGLPNRSLLRERIGEAIARVRRGRMFCVHYLDLDNFKIVNDTHGHSFGDLLLKEAATRFRACLTDTDILARLGGDEFVALQMDLEKPEQGGILARQLVEAIGEPFNLEGRQIYLGVSIGVAVCPGDGGDVDALLKNADMAMYRAKFEGRNAYRFFEFAMDARLQQRRALELDLRRAIANEEFEIYYQPQVDARTEAITGCEALLRWRHPTRGMVPPTEFIPVAEEIGAIVPLGAWVIRQACRDAATWPRPIGVAVNLSSAQFKGVALVQTVESALNASGLSPRRLELEITESALLADNETAIATLNHLRAIGVRIAMDDFGTGYSSLSYLRSFPFDKIKIDRSFIKDLGKDEDCSAIVRAIASLGAALGMATTAEGVETVEQLQHIRDQGCTEVQGYYFGRPCPIDELRGLFAANGVGARCA